MKKALNFIFGAILGGIIGAAAALLFAPFSGEKLRSELERKAQNIQIEIKEAASKKRVELEQQLEEMKKAGGKNIDTPA